MMMTIQQNATYISARRQAVLNQMQPNSIMLLFSGIEQHISVDAYHPFEVNKNFFYLTGIQRDHMVLMLDNNGEELKEILYIPQADPQAERWLGKKMTAEEAKQISGISEIRFVDAFDAKFERYMTDHSMDCVYFDTFRQTAEDAPDYNAAKAADFAKAYVGTPIKNCHPMLAKMRMQKDEAEVEHIREALKLTDKGLKRILTTMKPGMYEYQIQANFEHELMYNGAQSVSFPTIAGSGINGTMLHYGTNHCVAEDGTLILLDLGARYNGYCADITRTYPVNGKFTDRQKAVYNAVLAANKAVKAAAKPGITTMQLNDIAKDVLAKGLIELGIIQDAKDVGKYYMHGVSHHLGIDVHDAVNMNDKALKPGAVITDEPGLYIDEEAIGIRIEDDLLITEDGCICLSEDIIREVDQIEEAMKR